jgi:hypothetical protein
MRQELDPPQEHAGSTATSQQIGLVVLWAMTVAAAGGYLTGLAIDRFGWPGIAAVWAVGGVAGFVGRKLLTAPHRLAGGTLVVACVFAIVVAETCWLHWNTVQGEEGWWAAFAWLPIFVQEYELSALFAAIFTGFGAMSAYRQTAVRYVRVPIA